MGSICKIVPKITKEQFIRKAWIDLAKENVPFDVFESDFSKVREVEHTMLIDSYSYSASWEADIGYDRDETYIDIENYTERIPYTEYVTKYNSTTKSYDNIPETRYRNEQRQRQVVKHRTVTDWRYESGSHSEKTLIALKTRPSLSDDTARFRRAVSDSSTFTLEPTSNNFSRYTDLSASVNSSVNAAHSSDIESSICSSLPGHRHRSVTFSVNSISEENCDLYNMPEYSLSIQYNGKEYTKSAFPCSSIEFTGDKIANPISPEQIKANKNAELNSFKTKRNEKKEAAIWAGTKIPLFASLGMLTLSIIISLFLHFTALVIIGFVAGIGTHIFSRLHYNMVVKKEQKLASDDIAKETEKVNKEINNYENDYKAKTRELLNKKLSSLGLSPASPSEF